MQKRNWLIFSVWNRINILALRAYFSLFTFHFSLFTLSLTTSCTSEHVDDCFSNTGVQITETRTVAGFNKIELYDNVNLVLLPGASTEIEVEAGKNIVNAIKTEISDSALVIRNTMECNWVRNFDREITVFVFANDLKELRYEGSGDISSNGQISSDSLKVNVWGGSGSFDLDLNIDKLSLAQHYGTVDLHVRGRSSITTIFSNSYGPFYCSNLISDITYIRNNSSNNCYVYAKYILEVEIRSVGNIYYSGDPPDIKSDITGSGKLIKVE
ncbi:MAG: hypothetical protein CVU14_00780 [Bacteroidetes bacterium HGW-Bacteroidetes-9]|jgi:hypothetical protein|nr:MAG: hypothetical protein CVU14_00780 [Bacteroidetes bacterium HGW-Bacteroidetes-9]